MRSIPTSDTRTHASMTIPLSRTRSRTSMRLVPPAARSTGIGHSLRRDSEVRLLQRSRHPPSPRERGQLPFERPHLLLQFVVLSRQRLFSRRQMVIVLPPVETDLLRLVDRTDQQADTNGQQLDFSERHLDVAGNHESFVQNPVEDVDQPGGASMPSVRQWLRHRLGIRRNFIGTLAGRGWARDGLISAMVVPRMLRNEFLDPRQRAHQSPTVAQTTTY